MRFVANLLLCAALVAAAAAAISETEDLMGWKNFHFADPDAATAEAIRKFVDQYDLLIAQENLGSRRPQDVVVSPKAMGNFTQMLKDNYVQYEITDQDVGRMLLQEEMENAESSYNSRNDPSTYFARSNVIHSWIRQIATSNPSVASVENIGRSYEGKELLVLKISTNPSANKPILFVDGALHAREWLTPAVVNYMIKELLANRNSGSAKSLLSKYDVYFMPVANPDGYDYSHSSRMARYWRKTRTRYGFFYGADPNRNWDHQFGGPSTSNNPASDLYHGPKPFSEACTLNLSKFLTKIRSRLAKGMYLSLHTYGKMWLTPPGYTRVNPPDHAEMMRIGNIGKAAIQKANGIVYRVGQPANIGLYEAAGGSYDWVKFKLSIKYSFVLELLPGPGKGLAGFAAKVSDIPVSGKGIYAALLAVGAALRP